MHSRNALLLTSDKAFYIVAVFRNINLHVRTPGSFVLSEFDGNQYKCVKRIFVHLCIVLLK